MPITDRRIRTTVRRVNPSTCKLNCLPLVCSSSHIDQFIGSIKSTGDQAPLLEHGICQLPQAVFVSRASNAGLVETFFNKNGSASRRRKWTGLKRYLADERLNFHRESQTQNTRPLIDPVF
jgi:hypothetical protein